MGSLTNSAGPVVDVGLLAGLLITDLNLHIISISFVFMEFRWLTSFEGDVLVNKMCLRSTVNFGKDT